jgi:hypothetical protein
MTGTRICTKADDSHDELLLPLSPHLSLEVDWVVGQPDAESYDTEMTGYHHRKKRICGSNISAPSIHGRTCTGPASAKLIIILITLKQSGGQNMNISIKEIN